MFLCPEEEGTVRGAPPRGRFWLVWRHQFRHCSISYITHQSRRKNPWECFACDCAHPLSNSGAAKQGDTGAPEGGLPQREKTPTHRPWGFERGEHGSRSLFRRGRAGMTAPPNVADGCAEPSVGGMAPQESGAMALRHRPRRRRARLSPFPGRHSCGLGHQPNEANFSVAELTKRKKKKMKIYSMGGLLNSLTKT